MKLIIREYLSLLKESTELDRMLPDLLLMMNIEPISFAQVGVRQFGVDVAAVKKRTKGANELLLFTIKQGDIGRSDWNSNEHSVRPSLEEIKDVYLENNIRPEHKDCKKKIILCTGGSLKQDVEQNWKGHISRNTIKGEIEYEFWGGDKLAMLIERHMLNEQIVPVQHRSSFRKVLALLTDSDYDLIDYYEILNGLLFETNLKNKSNKINIKKATKTLRTINLLLNIIFYWSKGENNLKPSLLAAERTVLLCWEFLRNNNLFKRTKIIEIYFEIYGTFFNIYSAYFMKIQKHCYVKNGFHGYSRSSLLENLNVFEQLGIISITGIMYSFQYVNSKAEEMNKVVESISNALILFIRNHQSINSPFYDDHIVEISSAIFFLQRNSQLQFIDSWINEIINNIAYAYNSLNRFFPIESDSFEDIISLSITGDKNKEELLQLSTLIPILAQWCAVLNFEKTYNLIVDISKDVFNKTTYQIWYPDSETDQSLYTSNAAYKAGVLDAPFNIPETIEEMRERITSVNTKIKYIEDISSVQRGLYILPIISSRHYRTPFIPYYWQSGYLEEEKNEKVER